MRVLAVCVVVVGVALPAYAGVDPAAIERARAGTLTNAYQDDLPGHGQAGKLSPGDAAMPKGTGSAGERGSAAERMRRLRRDSARRVDTRDYQYRDRVSEQSTAVSGII
ncbi:MAG TPA: hypothetical protein VK427_00510, partial [Kofleriaceae bacterium]|nr:hypothetical protein [Kofleriaceae bacterium]